MNQEPGPSTTQSASRDRRDRLGAGRRVVGHQADRRRPRPGVVATATWPRTVDVASGRPGRARDLGHDVQRHGGHRQHPALRAEQPADPVEARDRVAEQLPQRDDQQVADRVAVQVARRWRSGAGATSRPGAAPLVVAAQRGQRHPQVAGRQHAELVAQPAARAAVVGDGDDRGQLVGDAAQRRQRRGQPVPAAERDDLAGRPMRDEGGAGPAGPVTRAPGRGGRRRSSTPWPRSSRAPSSSAIATLRCLPPVQPTAMVT